MAKYVIENSEGEVCINWGKFTALLGLCGALAVDSVEAGYAEGVTEVVDTFGLIVEQIMGEWILSEGGGWEGFIKINQYEPMLPPVPRTIIILTLIFLFAYITFSFLAFLGSNIFYPPEDPLEVFWRKWGNIYPHGYCVAGESEAFPIPTESFNGPNCSAPKNPLQYLYSIHPNL